MKKKILIRKSSVFAAVYLPPIRGAWFRKGTQPTVTLYIKGLMKGIDYTFTEPGNAIVFYERIWKWLNDPSSPEMIDMNEAISKLNEIE